MIAVLAAIAIFLPELAGLCRHVIYGNQATCREWRIPVPSDWFATHRGESQTFERRLHFPLLESAPTVVFLPVHPTKYLRFHASIWTSVQVELQRRRGYRLASTRKIVMGGAPGYCWEFVNRRDDSITCLAPSGRLSVDFSGPYAFAADFYGILPHIPWNPGSTGSPSGSEEAKARMGTRRGSVAEPTGFK